jgi:Zn-dependent alcohol dehydrogenase
MRAAVLQQSGQPVTIEDIRLDAPRAGEVLVRILASGVCHSDLHVRDGEWPRSGPFVIGHEGAGLIEALGPGLDSARGGLEVGGLIAHSWYAPCGRCPACTAGR